MVSDEAEDEAVKDGVGESKKAVWNGIMIALPVFSKLKRKEADL